MIILLVCLVLLSGFFSGSETAMMSLNRYRLRHQARKANPQALRVAKLLERPDRLLGVILIGNTFANILASAVATMIAVRYFGEIGVLISTVVLTFIILVFAEAAPKTLAALYPEKVAYPVGVILRGLLLFLYPLVWLVNTLANGVLRLFGVRLRRRSAEPLSLEELRSVVNEASGKITSNYHSMLLRLIDLEKVTVEDVMVPRSEIYGIDLDNEWDTILAQLRDAEHAHIPLYHENIDQVKGVLKLRKVLVELQHRQIEKADLLRLADEMYFVPETASLSHQLLHFQQDQQSLGLVVDEYGDVQGIVTLQDILEEIVGEFSEDEDSPSQLVREQRDGSVIVDASITLRELMRVTEWVLPVDGPKTLSGLIIQYLEMIPSSGLCCRIAGYPMEIVKANENTIQLVQVWPALCQRPVSVSEDT